MCTRAHHICTSTARGRAESAKKLAYVVIPLSLSLCLSLYGVRPDISKNSFYTLWPSLSECSQRTGVATQVSLVCLPQHRREQVVPKRQTCLYIRIRYLFLSFHSCTREKRGGARADLRGVVVILLTRPRAPPLCGRRGSRARTTTATGSLWFVGQSRRTRLRAGPAPSSARPSKCHDGVLNCPMSTT